MAAALMAEVLGERDEAWAGLDRGAFATADLLTVPRGPLRIVALAVAALVCDDLAVEGYDVRLALVGRGVPRRQLRLGLRRRHRPLLGDVRRPGGALMVR